jgi:signal transduction histidine kinase
MEKNFGKPPDLDNLLSAHKKNIVDEWANKIMGLPGSHYSRYPIDEIKDWVSRDLDAIINVNKGGFEQATNAYLIETAAARQEDGFSIYDLTEGLLISKEAILPVIRSSFPENCIRTLDLVAQLDDRLRRLIVKLELIFSEAMHELLHEEAHQRLIESESLQRTTTALLQKLTLDDILEIVCSEARQLTGATGSAVLLVEEGGWLQVTISTGSPSPIVERLPIFESLAGRAVQAGQPCLVNDPAGEIQAYSRNPDLQSLLVIPLRGKDENIGVIDVVNKASGFTDDDIRVMNLFADQAAIAIENARLHHHAENLAVIEERQRLARELHDSVTQSLYTVALYADAARLALSTGKSEVALENLQELRNMAREAMLDMRLLIFELHPPILEQEGLVAALRTRLESVEARSGIKTEFQVDGERRIPVSVEAELFRIAQEALNNAVKHSQAEAIRVHLIYAEDHFTMRVWDNGVGFDPERVMHIGGLGLRGMAERAQRINGKLDVVSAPGDGTTLVVDVDI